jgi:hypothetical protein
LNSGLHICKTGVLLLEPHLKYIFALGYFGDEVLQTVCQGWPRTMILPISASEIARITGVSHPHSAEMPFFFLFDYELRILSGQLNPSCSMMSCPSTSLISCNFQAINFRAKVHKISRFPFNVSQVVEMESVMNLGLTTLFSVCPCESYLFSWCLSFIICKIAAYFYLDINILEAENMAL